jgi:hypothetical protein
MPGKPIAFGGVTPEHVRAAVRVVARNAAVRLEELQYRTADPGRVRRFWDRLGRLADEEAERQRQAGAARLGQVFANAAENVDFWKGQWEGKNVVVLLCKTCGAPQEKTRDFRCGYCGGELFRRREEEES